MLVLPSAVTALLSAVLLMPADSAGSDPGASDPTTPTCAGQTATIVGTDDDDDLVGTPGSDVVWMGDGNDSYDGAQGGWDVVCAGNGNDHVWANGRILMGPGNDMFASHSGSPTVDMGPGNDRAYVQGGAEVRLGAGDDHAELMVGSPAVYGGPGDDRFDLWTDDDPDPGGAQDRGARMVGGPGTDTLSWEMYVSPMRLNTRGGEVTSQGSVFGSGPANNSEAHFDGLERYFGSPFADVMIGGPGPDDFHGAQGDDRLLGRGGRDVVYGGVGSDLCRAEVRHTCERR